MSKLIDHWIGLTDFSSIQIVGLITQQYTRDSYAAIVENHQDSKHRVMGP